MAGICKPNGDADEARKETVAGRQLSRRGDRRVPMTYSERVRLRVRAVRATASPRGWRAASNRRNAKERNRRMVRAERLDSATNKRILDYACENAVDDAMESRSFA
jgi:hypothetical protein